MNSNLNKKYLFRNSGGSFLYFHIKDDLFLYYDSFDENALFINSTKIMNSKIMDFSVVMDSDNNYHIITILKEGSLNYLFLSNGSIVKKVITRLDVKSNNYKDLEIILHDGLLNIFYSYSNLIMPSVSRIEYVFNQKNKWSKKTIISFTSDKFNNTFRVAIDKYNNIQLVYKDFVNNTNQIVYSCFNYASGKWITYPSKLSDINTNNNHPNLIVDSKNNIHVIWCVYKNSNFNLIYKRKSTSGYNKGKWIDINLPEQTFNCTHPILIEDDDILKIIYKQGDSLKVLYSQDFGQRWQIDEISNDKDTFDFCLINYKSNYYNNDYPSFYVYGKTDSKIELFNIHEFLNIKELTQIEEIVDTNISLIDENEILSETKETTNIEVENLEIIEFISTVKESFEKITTEINDLSKFKEEIEKIILDNTKSLDEKLIHKKNILIDSFNTVNALNDKVHKYEVENKNFSNKLKSLSSKLDSNKLSISDIKSEINELKKELEKLNKPNIIEKITNIFK